jgi:hypothetical protein
VSDYLDPTDSVAVPRKTAPRPSSLDGKVITLLDISKAKGDHLLDRLEELLRERAKPKAIVRKKKPTFARPAPAPLREEIARATDVVIEALAD